jgi:hypothetical protein
MCGPDNAPDRDALTYDLGDLPRQRTGTGLNQNPNSVGLRKGCDMGKTVKVSDSITVDFTKVEYPPIICVIPDCAGLCN